MNISMKLIEMLINAFVVIFFSFLSRFKRLLTELLLAGIH